MKKSPDKRKKVIIDALDGKIINEPIALKIKNIPEYLEKNGIKVVKLLLLFLLNLTIVNSVKAMDILDLNLANLPTYKLAFTLNILLLMFIIAILCIIFGIKFNSIYIYYLGCIIGLFLGLMLLVNGFNVLIGIFIIFISIIFIWATV